MPPKKKKPASNNSQKPSNSSRQQRKPKIGKKTESETVVGETKAAVERQPEAPLAQKSRNVFRKPLNIKILRIAFSIVVLAGLLILISVENLSAKNPKFYLYATLALILSGPTIACLAPVPRQIAGGNTYEDKNGKLVGSWALPMHFLRSFRNPSALIVIIGIIVSGLNDGIKSFIDADYNSVVSLHDELADIDEQLCESEYLHDLIVVQQSATTDLDAAQTSFRALLERVEDVDSKLDRLPNNKVGSLSEHCQFLKGALHLNLGSLKKAESFLSGIAGHSRIADRAKLRLARVYMLTDQFDLADAVLDEVAIRYEGESILSFYRAKLCVEQGRLGDAADHYFLARNGTQIIERFPKKLLVGPMLLCAEVAIRHNLGQDKKLNELKPEFDFLTEEAIRNFEKSKSPWLARQLQLLRGTADLAYRVPLDETASDLLQPAIDLSGDPNLIAESIDICSQTIVSHMRDKRWEELKENLSEYESRVDKLCQECESALAMKLARQFWNHVCKANVVLFLRNEINEQELNDRNKAALENIDNTTEILSSNQPDLKWSLQNEAESQVRKSFLVRSRPNKKDLNNCRTRLAELLKQKDDLDLIDPNLVVLLSSALIGIEDGLGKINQL